MTDLLPASSREVSPHDLAELRRDTVLSIEVLAGVPSWGLLRSEVDRASRLVPRMRQHVVAPTLPVGSARWVTDPDMNLDHHLRRVSLPAPGSLRQLLDLAETLHATPLDLSRPLWQATFVEGLVEDGAARAALIWAFSLPVVDGVGAVALDRALHAAEPQTEGRRLPPLPSPRDLSPGDLTRDELRRLPLTVGRGLLRGAGDLARVATGSVSHPQDLVRQIGRLAGSVQRLGADRPTASSPLLKRRGRERRFETLEVALEDLRAAARPHGYSLHDAYVASVCGGLRRYHEKLGVPVDVLTLAMPIGGRDLWSGVRMVAPVGEVDPVTRMRLVREAVLTARSEPTLGLPQAVAPFLSWLPDLGSRPAAPDVLVSSSAGQPTPVHLAGVLVDRIIPISPLRGGAVVLVMYSTFGRCQVGVNLDPAAISEPDAFVACLQAGFDEVIASARAGKTKTRAAARPRRLKVAGTS